jgi:enamine deaminase RidA (YjgF/YER057c/UK114 family)
VSDYETTNDLGSVGPTQRLAVLGIELPDAPAPAAAYVGHVTTGNLLQTAGQIALAGGELLATGRVGDAVDLVTAQACARQCAVNVMAQIRAAGHALEDVRRVVKLTVFVASTPDFTDQHLVADGASELFGEVFGDAGRHARSAVGVAVLPLNSPVEVEALVELDTGQ